MVAASSHRCERVDGQCDPIATSFSENRFRVVWGNKYIRGERTHESAVHCWVIISKPAHIGSPYNHQREAYTNDEAKNGSDKV
jgi:hypothetical protein